LARFGSSVFKRLRAATNRRTSGFWIRWCAARASR
jgi:hypothetical protein